MPFVFLPPPAPRFIPADLVIPYEIHTFERKIHVYQNHRLFQLALSIWRRRGRDVQPGPVFREAGFRVLLYTGELIREKLRALDTETLELRPLSAPGGCKANANKEFLIESIRQEKVDVIIVQGVMEFPSAAIRQATSCKVIFCLHNKPFWEIQFLREQKPSRSPIRPWPAGSNTSCSAGPSTG